HIPVCAYSERGQRQAALRAGAAAYLDQPVTEALDRTLDALEKLMERRVKKLLVVEDDEAERGSIVELVGSGEDVESVAVGSSDEALAALDGERFDCIVMDLNLPDATGFTLLEQIKKDQRFRDLPVIVHTGAELTRKDETRLKKYAESIIVKDVSSPERLLDETTL